jgi:hypothetical protein
MRVADVRHAVFASQAMGTALYAAAASIPKNVNLNWALGQGQNASKLVAVVLQRACWRRFKIRTR